MDTSTNFQRTYIVPHLGIRMVNRSSQFYMMASFCAFAVLMEVVHILVWSHAIQHFFIEHEFELEGHWSAQQPSTEAHSQLSVLLSCASMVCVTLVQWQLKRVLEARDQQARSVFRSDARRQAAVSRTCTGDEQQQLVNRVQCIIFRGLNILFTVLAFLHLAIRYVLDNGRVPLPMVLALPFLAQLHVGAVRSVSMAAIFTLLAITCWTVVLWVRPLFLAVDTLASSLSWNGLHSRVWYPLMEHVSLGDCCLKDRFVHDYLPVIAALFPLYVFYVLKNVLSMHVRTWIKNNELNLWHHMVFLDTVLESMPCAIWQEQLDQDGHIRFKGYRGSLLDQTQDPLSIFAAPDGCISKADMQSMQSATEHVIRTGQRTSGILDYLPKNGSDVVNISYTLSPLRNPRCPDNVDSVIGVGVNVTTFVRSQTRLKQREHSYSQLVHNISDVIMRLDRDYTIQFINKSVFLDRPREYFIGRNFLDLGFHSLRHEVEVFLRQTLEDWSKMRSPRAYVKFEWAYDLRKRHCIQIGQMDSPWAREEILEGNIVVLSTRATPLIEWSESSDDDSDGENESVSSCNVMHNADDRRSGFRRNSGDGDDDKNDTNDDADYESGVVYRDKGAMKARKGRFVDISLSHGEAVGIILSTRDITEQKRSMELERRSQEERLSSKSKSEFISQMSHEIRNPLHAIIGTLDLLVHSENLTLTQFEYVDDCRQSAHILLDILGDILDVERIAQGKFSIAEKQNSIVDLIEGVVEMQTANSRARGIELLSFVDPALSAQLLFDRVRMNQILTNLLSNAVKFTYHGYVCLSANMVEDYPDRVLVRFDCEDTGIGIKQDDMEKLFRPFEQVSNGGPINHVDTDGCIAGKGGFDRGFGLGLDIVSKLVRIMDGRIDIRSEFGKGSTFSVFLKLRKPIISTGSSSSSGSSSASASISVTPLRNYRVSDSLPPSVFSGALIVGCSKRLTQILETYLRALQVSSIHTPAAPSDARPGVSSKRCQELLVDLCKSSHYRSTVIIIDCQTRELFDWACRVTKCLDRHCKVIALVSLEMGEMSSKGAESAEILRLRKPVRLARLSKALHSSGDTPLSPLPFAPTLKITEARPHLGRQSRLKSISVLVVEDNPINSRILCAFLKKLGCERVQSVFNGKEAIDFMQNVPGDELDLVLMDLSMPVMDGYAALRAIRAMSDSKKRNVPVVAVTGNSDQETADRCRKAGFRDVLVKPCTMDDIGRILWEISSGGDTNSGFDADCAETDGSGGGTRAAAMASGP